MGPRLLDVQSSEGRFENELIFYMVFEYMEQDLDHFISQCPTPGLEESLVKVCSVILLIYIRMYVHVKIFIT